MEFGCNICNRSFNELKLWSRLVYKNYKWICTSCDVRLVRDPDARKMEFGCRTCNHTFEELSAWGGLKDCGDHWNCLGCNDDLRRDPETVFNECNLSAIQSFEMMRSSS